MIRKLVFQRDDLVAGLPIQAAQQQRQARRRIVNEGDVGGLAVNECRDARANPVASSNQPMKSVQANSSRRAKCRATASAARRGICPNVAVFR